MYKILYVSALGYTDSMLSKTFGFFDEESSQRLRFFFEIVILFFLLLEVGSHVPFKTYS